MNALTKDCVFVRGHKPDCICVSCELLIPIDVAFQHGWQSYGRVLAKRGRR